MDGPAIAAYIGLGLVVLVNVSGIAYGYGRLSAKVEGLHKRMARIEKSFNGLVSWRK